MTGCVIVIGSAYFNAGSVYQWIVSVDTWRVSIEVRRTYNDYTASHGTLFWEKLPSDSIIPGACCAVCGGVGCETCSFTTQALCVHSRNTKLGTVAISPAAYDSTDERWEFAAQSVCRDPDEITVNYYSGEQDGRYLSGYSCDPLDEYLAVTIAYLATARLERPFCNCGSITALASDLRRDRSLVGSSSGDSWFVPEELISNPFGTRQGEIKAWQRITSIMEESVTGVLL